MLLNFQNSKTSDFTAQEPLLDNLLNQTQQQLSEFAQSDQFALVLETSFGTDGNTEEIANLQQALYTGVFFDQIEIETLPASELGALGAYANESNTIFIAQDLLASSPGLASSVLLEEAGHAVDDFLNETDSTGDEGKMFASLVQGHELSSQTLTSLRQEDDGATLNIDNESVAVEQAEFTVSSTEDTNVSGTLRATIALANSTPEADTITFDSSLANETITLSEGNLTIKNPLTIEGLGSEELTINTEGNSRVFNINKEDNEENIQVTIQDLTISGGSTNDSGGGIFNTKNLTLKNTTISGNTAEEGGGIANDNGTINLTNSTISSNSGTFLETGGSISNSDGIINLTNSTISNNSDGGINNSGTIKLINSTVSGNSDKGIDNNGVINLTNSTISNNSDGGINNNNGTIILTNSTISGNSGSGINNKFQSTLNIKNSIVANSNEADINQGGTINTYGTNIVEDGSITGIINIDPNLSPLQDNGGPTLTQVPLEGSVAIDAGDNSVLPADTSDLDGDGDTEEQIPFDQRGEDFDRVVNGTVDLGAVEVQQEPTEIPVNIADFEATEGNANETTTFTFTVSLNQSPSQDLTVDFATSDGTATAGEDYVATDGTLTFEQGVTEQTIEVPVLGDNNNESDETFTVELSDPTGSLTLSDGTATGTIQNDDGEIQLNTVILTGADQQITIPFNADIRGTSGEETLLIRDGTTVNFNPQSGDRVDVAQPLTDYNIERTGLTELALTDSNGGETITLTVNQNQAFELRFAGGDTTVDLNSSGEITVGNEALGVNEQANLENINLGNNPSEVAPQAQTSAVLEQDASFSENEENELAKNVGFSSGTALEQIEDANPRLEVPTNNLEELSSEAVIEL